MVPRRSRANTTDAANHFSNRDRQFFTQPPFPARSGL